ncbi:MAG: chorismate-binding protein [Prevotella sp.]
MEYTEIVQTNGDPLRLPDVESLNGMSGFVIAPFAVTEECPVLLLRPDKVMKHSLPYMQDYDYAPEGNLAKRVSCRDEYSGDFHTFHSRISDGTFSKIVLARQSIDIIENTEPPRRLFERACRLYSNMFVALVSTPVSGTWLTATPELLLEGQQGEYRTIALAGTMGLWGNTLWSEKNKSEQQYVASYIEDCISGFSDSCSKNGPYTVAAGDVRHLRTDFTFSLRDNQRIGDFLAELHPTPAVCGLPKQEAMRFIIDNESVPRRYYSGFMGMIGDDRSAHLFVSLRCMEICGNEYRLHAGGGLLADSEEEAEWNETESKMQTIRRCFTRKIR